MVKTIQSLHQVFLSSDKTSSRDSSIVKHAASNDTDVVTISEEGKKRRIMGHVMASISEAGGTKRRIER